MSVSMYQATIPVFIRGLRVVSALLEKAQAHVEEDGIVPEILLGAQLAPDMLDLTAQVQRASDTSKLSVEHLSGVASPKFEDNETSFDQLQQRIRHRAMLLDMRFGLLQQIRQHTQPAHKHGHRNSMHR